MFKRNSAFQRVVENITVCQHRPQTVSALIFGGRVVMGLGVGFPKILSKCFSGSPSPYIFLLSLYEQIYYVFLSQGHFIVSG